VANLTTSYTLLDITDLYFGIWITSHVCCVMHNGHHKGRYTYLSHIVFHKGDPPK
jgi:hypothetical protein